MTYFIIFIHNPKKLNKIKNLLRQFFPWKLSQIVIYLSIQPDAPRNYNTYKFFMITQTGLSKNVLLIIYWCNLSHNNAILLILIDAWLIDCEESGGSYINVSSTPLIHSKQARRAQTRRIGEIFIWIFSFSIVVYLKNMFFVQVHVAR